MKEPDKCKTGCGGHRDTKPNACPDYKPKSKITKGVWEQDYTDVRDECGDIIVDCGNRHLTLAEEEANATLIADAGTVHNETGLTPRQLLEQRDALLDVCKWLDGVMDGDSRIWCAIREHNGCVEWAKDRRVAIKLTE